MEYNIGCVVNFLSFLSLLLVFVISFFRIRNDKQLTAYHFGFYSLHVVGVLFSFSFLAISMINKDYSMAYVWEHASNDMASYYLFSAIWEGQEGSFLLWLLFQAVLGLFFIRSKPSFWLIYSLISLGIHSMILGIEIPFSNELPIGESPFLSLQQKFNWPIFDINEGFIPADGNGLNLLLRNIWMVIHPPVIFLSFALASIPFSIVTGAMLTGDSVTGSSLKKVLGWTFLIMTLGIIMGSYWAYETLNFGGYWSWDPVENAIYVPWLLVLCCFHLSFYVDRNEKSKLFTYHFVLVFFLTVIYSTFLTRSGVLGDSSVHSFTSSGLSNQLLFFLFGVLSLIVLAIVRHQLIKEKPVDKRWCFSAQLIRILTVIVSFAAFQVLLSTSFPVINAIGNFFGKQINLAPPKDPLSFYGNFQIGFVMLSVVLLLFYYSRSIKMYVNKMTFFIGCVFCGAIILLVQLQDVYFGFALLIFSVTLFILILNFKNGGKTIKSAKISHIGFVIMLIGILVSATKQEVVSATDSIVGETVGGNLLVKRGEPQFMDEYGVSYKGSYYQYNEVYIPEDFVLPTAEENKFLLRKKVVGLKDSAGSVLTFNGENRFFKIDLNNSQTGKKRIIYPRIQQNEKMGTIASPVIVHQPFSDLYLHVANFPDPTKKDHWKQDTFLVTTNQYALYKGHQSLKVTGVEETKNVPGYILQEDESAEKITLEIGSNQHGLTSEYICYHLKKGEEEMVIPDYSYAEGFKIAVKKLPEGEFSIRLAEAPTDWVVIKAIHFPWVSLFWIGAILCMVGLLSSLIKPIKVYKTNVKSLFGVSFNTLGINYSLTKYKAVKNENKF